MKDLNFQKGISKMLPEVPGIYIFKNSQKTPIYVGKSKNLKLRVNSYFALDLEPKTKRMIKETSYLSYIKVETEFEALLLEVKLVRKFMPKYNSQLKDDKSPLYIAIIKEKFPRVLTLRQTELKKYQLKRVFGPYINAKSVRLILKKVRVIFPFSQHKLGKKPCIYSQIGLCNPCPNMILRIKNKKLKVKLENEYKLNLRNLERVLLGKHKRLKKVLEQEIKLHSKKEEFEIAQKKLQQLRSLEALTSETLDVNLYLEDPNLIDEIRKKETTELKNILRKYLKIKKLNRIECYDIAHLAGTFPTASMVTFFKGQPDKRFYRHFQVSYKNKKDDSSSLKSVLERRIKHYKDWGIPDLIIVDGGKPQVTSACSVIKNIPVIGLAKRYETLVIKSENKFISVRLANSPAKRLFQRIRDESHRFARRYHHKLVSQALKKSLNLTNLEKENNT